MSLLPERRHQPFLPFLQDLVVHHRYGPRPSDRKTSFSEQGWLHCDVKLATFATRQRGKGFAQVSQHHCS